MPKGRESGMPEVEVWQRFFDPAHILDRLDCDKPGNVVEFGCGYGLFTVEAANEAGPAATIATINRGLKKRNIESKFVTMFFGVLSADGTLSGAKAS